MTSLPLDKLDRFIALGDDEARKQFGISVREAHAEGICISCKRAFSPDDHSPGIHRYSALGPYRKIGMCLVCWEGLIRKGDLGPVQSFSDTDREISGLGKKVYELAREHFPWGPDQPSTNALFEALKEVGIDLRKRADLSLHRCAENIVLKTRFGLQYGQDEWATIATHPSIAAAMATLCKDVDEWFWSLPIREHEKIGQACRDSV